MSEVTTVVSTPVEAKPVTKAKIKPKAKPAPKVKDETRSKTFHGVECPSGKFWNAKRQLIVEALRKLGAESAMTACSSESIAKKTGAKDIEPGTVVRYCSDHEPLVSGLIIKKVKHEEAPTTRYHLTALGKKCKFDY